MVKPPLHITTRKGVPYHKLSKLDRATLEKIIEQDPVDWAELNFYVEDSCDPITGEEFGPGPIQLAPFQKRIIRAALERDGLGRFLWNTVIYSAPKKSGKTRISAMVASWLAKTSEAYAEIYLAANDGSQSEDRLLSAVKKAVDLSPALSKWKSTRGKVILPSGAFVEAIPVDPTGQAGSNPVGVFWSELWGYAIAHKQRLFTEMTLSPVRRGRSIRWVDTYAGYSGESPVLENLYEQTVVDGECHPDFLDLPVYINKPARIFCYWDHEPRMPWQLGELGRIYYAQEEAILPPHEFLRLHKNMWVTSSEAFIEPEWWKACREDNLGIETLDPFEPLIIAMDAATSDDCFAIVGTTRHPDEARYDTDVAVRYTATWTAPKGGKINFAEPEEELEWLCENYNVVVVTYDEYQLHDMTSRLRQKGIAYFKPFSQMGRRIESDTDLRRLILRRGIAHDGDETLTQHIINCAAKLNKEDKRLRMVKKTQSKKIDAAVALSMSAYECLRLNL
jgi:phage terminase large subunit-like protein